MGRASIRTKATRSNTTTPAVATTTDRNSKKTARLARHAKFVSRIEKKAANSSVTTTKRRRSQKKLLSTLDSLADALPDINVSADRRTELEDVLGAKKGLKSRPGAMKRKETLLKSECERFGKNLAILESGKGGEAASAPASGWAMLRGFIGATIEKKEEFLEMEKKEKEKTMGMEAEA